MKSRKWLLTSLICAIVIAMLLGGYLFVKVKGKQKQKKPLVAVEVAKKPTGAETLGFEPIAKGVSYKNILAVDPRGAVLFEVDDRVKVMGADGSVSDAFSLADHTSEGANQFFKSVKNDVNRYQFPLGSGKDNQSADVINVDANGVVTSERSQLEPVESAKPFELFYGVEDGKLFSYRFTTNEDNKSGFLTEGIDLNKLDPNFPMIIYQVQEVFRKEDEAIIDGFKLGDKVAVYTVRNGELPSILDINYRYDFVSQKFGSNNDTALIAAVKDGRFGYIDALGNEKIPFKYDTPIGTELKKGSYLKENCGTAQIKDASCIAEDKKAANFVRDFPKLVTPNYQMFRNFESNSQYAIVAIEGNNHVVDTEGNVSVRTFKDAVIVGDMLVEFVDGQIFTYKISKLSA